MIIYILFSLSIMVNLWFMYLVNDYRKGIIYKGFVGKIQNFIKH